LKLSTCLKRINNKVIKHSKKWNNVTAKFTAKARPEIIAAADTNDQTVGDTNHAVGGTNQGRVGN
jgi:hypothetical protein